MDEPAKKTFWTRHHNLPRIAFPRLITVKRLRALLFVAVCFATFIALFYAEEDARGKLLWNRYVAKAKARGINLDWRAYVPAPVPDDQNLAMAPLFAGMFDYQYVSNRIEWRQTNVWTRRDHVSFQGSTNRGVHPEWVTGRPVDLKAWQDFFRTAKLPEPKYWPAPAEAGEPAQDVLFALRKIEPELEELRQAATRPQSRFPVHYDEIESAVLAHLAYLVSLSEAVDLRAVAELALGDTASAFADTKLAFRCADALETESFLISQLVRCRIIESALQPVWEGLRSRRWTDGQLTEFEASFAKPDLLARFLQVRQTDLAFTCAWIDSLSAEPDKLGLSENQTFPVNGWEAALQARLLPRGWILQNEVSAARFLCDTTLKDVDDAGQRVYPEIAAQNSKLFEALPLGPYNFAFKHLNGVQSPQRFAQVQTELNLATVACALERYRLAHGKFPASLEELAPDYPGKLPHDVITGDPLKYRLGNDGEFILYSVGWNQKDDGGAFPKGLDPAGNFKRYQSEKGDWVWRYDAN